MWMTEKWTNELNPKMVLMNPKMINVHENFIALLKIAQIIKISQTKKHQKTKKKQTHIQRNIKK